MYGYYTLVRRTKLRAQATPTKFAYVWRRMRTLFRFQCWASVSEMSLRKQSSVAFFHQRARRIMMKVDDCELGGYN